MNHRDIPLPDVLEAKDPNIISGPQDIYDLVRFECARRLVDSDLGELLFLDPYYDEHTGKTTNERVRHELVVFETAISEVGIVRAGLPRGLLHQSIGYQLDQFEQKCAGEQPGCEWRMVAVIISRIVNTVTTERPYTGEIIDTASPLEAVRGQKAERTHSVQLEKKVERAEVQDPRCFIQAVYADMVQGQLRDLNEDIEPGFGGPMKQYAISRALRDMSAGMRGLRAKATRLLKAGHPSMWRPSKEDGAKIAPTLEVPMVSIPRAVDHRERILELRAGSKGNPPMNPQAIAKELGLAHDDVRELLRRENVARG